MHTEEGEKGMAWFYVLLAAVVEVFWVIGLRYSSTIWEWIGTAIAIVFSFYFIIKSCEKLPSGTVYAVFTGLGAAAIVTLDFVVFDAPFSVGKVLFIALIITGVIGIKLTTDEKERKADSSDEGGK